MGRRPKPKKNPKSSQTHVIVRLETLKMLCLNVDYGLPPHAKDKVESLSVALAKRFKFDTHEFRLARKFNVGFPPGDEKLKRVAYSECPVCAASDGYSSGEDTTFDGELVTCRGDCANCGADWVETYRLESVE